MFFLLPPEASHTLSLKLLNGLHKIGFKQSVPTGPIEVMGLMFPNRVGLAAGYDKNGEAIDALAGLGFGFIEVGTVTPKPQRGNPKPRLFRLKAENAVINRMGFNNQGVEALVKHVSQSHYKGILGINIGKNAATPMEHAVDDYLLCLEKVYPVASYVTVNISSPNTKNLRALQEGDSLADLLAQLKQRQSQLHKQHGRYVPLLLKVAPDIDSTQLKAIAQTVLAHKIDGMIATNTTVERDGLVPHQFASVQGGLSGRPLFDKSLSVVRQLRAVLGPDFPLIGVGGIDCGERAKMMMEAGADLVQIYSGLVYKGPTLIQEVAQATCANEDKEE